MRHVALLALSLLFILGWSAVAADAGTTGSTPDNASNKVYKTTDDHGRPVFTDRASEGAQEVEVDKPMTFPAREFAEDYRQFTPLSDDDEAPSGPPYGTMAITSPTNDEAIRNNAGNMEVTFRLSPGLKQGHELRLLMDGAVVQNVASSEPIALTNVDRGTHTLQLEVVNRQSGKSLQTSDTVTFTILRHSIQHPKPPPPRPRNPS